MKVKGQASKLSEPDFVKYKNSYDIFVQLKHVHMQTLMSVYTSLCCVSFTTHKQQQQQ